MRLYPQEIVERPCAAGFDTASVVCTSFTAACCLSPAKPNRYWTVMVIRGAIIGKWLAARAVRSSPYFLGQPDRNEICSECVGEREDRGSPRFK